LLLKDKIRKFLRLILGVDSEKLLEEINKQATKINSSVKCLLQMHIAEEDSKFGFDESEIKELLDSGRLGQMDHVKICGMMGMATFTDDYQQIRRELRELKSLFDKVENKYKLPNIDMKILSMGMSADYRIALEEGSNMVRIGTSIFGERNY